MCWPAQCYRAAHTVQSRDFSSAPFFLFWQRTVCGVAVGATETETKDSILNNDFNDGTVSTLETTCVLPILHVADIVIMTS